MSTILQNKMEVIQFCLIHSMRVSPRMQNTLYRYTKNLKDVLALKLETELGDDIS